ncbi:MAG: BamA/TamA family outer membrane protein [Chthoniobacterales bacterium]|nr:BamA/TamA family outer membrane protein [Chthoniobacterales bacterium]
MSTRKGKPRQRGTGHAEACPSGGTRFRASRLASFVLIFCLTIGPAFAQTAVKLPEQEQREKQKKAVSKEQEKIAQQANLEIRGNAAFDDETLRSQLKEQLTFIAQNGLTAARADDAAFFLELYYKKRGYAKVNVRYTIVSGNRLRLDISEGPLVHLGTVQFIGNRQIQTEKLFDYAVSPIREGDAAGKGLLPYVPSQLAEGAELVQRFYVSEGYVEAVVEPPTSRYVQPDLVRAQIVIQEGRKYSFGNINFVGPTLYGGEALRGQILDLSRRPYTEARVADIQRRIQSYYKTRGYYAVEVNAIGDPSLAINGQVPVRVTVNPRQVYYYDGITVQGTRQLRPSYLFNRFKQYRGQPYSPETLDKKFRELTRTGLFNIVRIKPTPVHGNELRLDITVEEAKPQEFGFYIGYGTYEGAIVGASYANRDLFGFGRPITTSVEYTQRSYKADILFEDPYLFNTGFGLKARLFALTFDYDGYSKFELGGRVTLSRQVTDAYSVGLVLGARHVEITDAGIRADLLGDTKYFITTVGFTHTLDLRKNPLSAPRGFVIDNTVDLATSALGSDIELLRATGRVSYYLSFAPEQPQLTGEDLQKSSFQKWFERSLLAFGARAGVVYPLDTAGVSEALAIPIDERFFNGGSTTVRSFAERELGPSNRGNPIGGEFYTIFNVEYTFPIYGELLGAVFVDAGNLLPEASQPGLNDMRYGVGLGLRYNLPIGPIRLDYGVNPNPRQDEAFGAFHFSIGFAF